MANGAIETVLWPGIRDIVGSDAVLSGIEVNKPGYHASRDWLRLHYPRDYSIQLAIDKLGPDDLGAAIDVTFKSAQGGDFRNIAKYSRRLYSAGVQKDPRTYALREFQGNIDLDRDVEGWSYYRGWELTGGSVSHLWHIHQSIHRKYINDAAAMRAILEIWDGEELVPSAKEIAEELATNKQFLDAVADAVLTRDGKIVNNFTDNAANTHVSLATAQGVIGERTKPQE